MAAACPVAAPAASPARTPHSVGVIFELRRADARPGETLSVTGGGRELGDWGAEDTCGLQLRTSVPVYPLWTMLSPVWIEVLEGQEELWLEYKYVRDLGQWGQAGHRIVWEDDIENRRARIPCKQPGVWVVSDAVWGGEGIQEIKLTLESEIGRRRNMLDPDPLAMPATVPGLPSAPTKKALRGRPQMYNMTPMASPRDQSSDSYAIEEEYDHLPLGSPTNTRPSLTPFPTAFSTPCPTPFPTPLPTLRLGAPGGGGGGGGGCAGSPGGLAKPGSPTSTPLPTPRLGARGTRRRPRRRTGGGRCPCWRFPPRAPATRRRAGASGGRRAPGLTSPGGRTRSCGGRTRSCGGRSRGCGTRSSGGRPRSCGGRTRSCGGRTRSCGGAPGCGPRCHRRRRRRRPVPPPRGRPEDARVSVTSPSWWAAEGDSGRASYSICA